MVAAAHVCFGDRATVRNCLEARMDGSESAVIEALDGPAQRVLPW